LEPVFAACSAAALYRREMINDTGFLDSDFFLYDEDVDLSFRAQRADWKCMYVSDAVVKDNATAGRLSDTHVYDHARNLEFVWIKLKICRTGLILRFAHPQDYSGIGIVLLSLPVPPEERAFFRAKRDAKNVACHAEETKTNAGTETSLE
jgi:hypothetical protein